MTEPIVIQNTREEWLRLVLMMAGNPGVSFEFDYSEVRPQGRPLNRDGLSVVGCYLDETREMK